MKTVAEAINQTIAAYEPLIRSIGQAEFARKPSETKWSRKEILGHLVDSAQNNLQRFVRGQYEDTPHIIYNQDEWVRLQHYREYTTDDLIGLWVLLNRHLSYTLHVMNPSNYDRTCDTGKQEPSVHTLKFLAEDYLAHMKHHLRQIVAETP